MWLHNSKAVNWVEQDQEFKKKKRNAKEKVDQKKTLKNPRERLEHQETNSVVET